MPSGAKMKWCFLAVAAIAAVGCESTDIENDGGTVVVDNCKTTSEKLDIADAGSEADPPGVVATCDDHRACTIDIQCTPCSSVPEPIRFVKATCTPDALLSPFCYDSDDISTRKLLYVGCTHITADPTPPGVVDACFPVDIPADANSVPRSGVCNAVGVCVEQPGS